MLVLPTEKSIPKVQNPRLLVIFGKPKSGKTTLASRLENNLIIDLEGGSEFLSALSIQARNINDLGEIATLIRNKNKEAGKFFYDYITIDNTTRLEEMCLSYATQLYNQTPMGKAFKGDVRTLPNGGGYLYLRQAVRKVIDMFRELAEHIILIGHTKDIYLSLQLEIIVEKPFNCWKILL